jgi:hypothetical protein
LGLRDLNVVIAPRIPVATIAKVEGSGTVVSMGSMVMVPGNAGAVANGLYVASKVPVRKVGSETEPVKMSSEGKTSVYALT